MPEGLFDILLNLISEEILLQKTQIIHISTLKSFATLLNKNHTRNGSKLSMVHHFPKHCLFFLVTIINLEKKNKIVQPYVTCD